MSEFGLAARHCAVPSEVDAVLRAGAAVRGREQRVAQPSSVADESRPLGTSPSASKTTAHRSAPRMVSLLPNPPPGSREAPDDLRGRQWMEHLERLVPDVAEHLDRSVADTQGEEPGDASLQ